jgi:hypothetical protein
VKRTAALVVLALGASLALSACDNPPPGGDGSTSSNAPADMTRNNKGTTRKGG